MNEKKKRTVRTPNISLHSTARNIKKFTQETPNKRNLFGPSIRLFLVTKNIT